MKMSATATDNVAHAWKAAAARPLGPGSLTWRLLGDRRVMLFLTRTGTLQNMHPAVGAGVQDHSNLFDDPWDRLFRSVPYIAGVVYDPPTQAIGSLVRSFHDEVKGVDAHGDRYHALNPEVFWWTHATFIEVCIASQEFFGTPLTDAEKDQLVAEGITWWQCYGLSMAPVLTTYADFDDYWQRMLDNGLGTNATTDYAVNSVGTPVPAPPHIPNALWDHVLQRPAMKSNLWLMAGLMPESARTTLGLSWSRTDQLVFSVVATGIRRLWPLLPERARYIPRAYENIARARKHPELYAT